MWYVIMVRIMQCAIGTRNHETTVSAEDTRYRHMTAYNTERIHLPLKIRRATQTQKPCCSVMQCIRSAFANNFVTNSSAPLFGSDSRNYSVAKIFRHTVYPVMVYCTFVCCGFHPMIKQMYCTQTSTQTHRIPTYQLTCMYILLT